MKKKKLRIELKPIDIFIEITNILGVIVLIATPLYFYNDLPDTIPAHFGLDGNIDKISDKDTIWYLPIVGVVNYALLLFLNRFPHIFNYPQKVTDENRERLYQSATRMIRGLNFIIVYSFAYISYSTIEIALGVKEKIEFWFLPIFISLLLMFIVYSVYKLMKK
ncbi:MAG: hypothetical protein CR982_06760 [Candidatus Cloacimonadota bacterium]|nr:MAG: hypothetical protein CR982_06760 [Candidatus Cloacimonadota bacterium]PIE77816.1 MAG: hypothetical protein CSA15_11005 [Candidatus Delongbacteria bacterium]